MRKIALEEHFSGPGFEKYLEAVAEMFDPGFLSSAEKFLPEFDEKRLSMMDKCGIDIAVLSQTAPGVQAELDKEAATQAARRSNDFLSEQINRNPSRYRGFGCIALQDPESAAEEVVRCVKELGFVGILVNGHTAGEYLDEEKFQPFWEQLNALKVPLYLHPGNPYDKPHMYSGRPELNGATWSWTCETATHALRLVFGGIFDRYSDVKVILGHMGETLPFMLWRLDSRALTSPGGRAMKKPPSQYIREHIVITTSGVCANGPLLCSLSEMGEDSVMFSTDYPYEDAELAAQFIDNAPISLEQREKVCFRTAEHLFRISLEPQSAAATALSSHSYRD